MHNLKEIRKDFDTFRKAIEKRSVEVNFEKLKEIYSQQDVERFSSLAYLFSLGIGVKNLTIIKSMTDRGVGFLESYFRSLNMDNDDAKVAVEKFSIVIGSYILEDLFIETNPVPVKAALAMKGLVREEYRLPLVKMHPANRSHLCRTLKSIGYIK